MVCTLYISASTEIVWPEHEWVFSRSDIIYSDNDFSSVSLSLSRGDSYTVPIIIPLDRVLDNVHFFCTFLCWVTATGCSGARGVFRMYEYIVHTHHHITSHIWVSAESLDS